jgi:hypothetical protein
MRVLLEFDFPGVTDSDAIVEGCFDKFDLRRMESETGAKTVTLVEVFEGDN